MATLRGITKTLRGEEFRIALLPPSPFGLILPHKYSVHKEAGVFWIEFMMEVSAQW
jgi:hypothetical protein